jgi:LmbE family N-acetylglucosaminyl deacetylase
MLNFGKTLVIVAHPDDEVLGCGGLIANLTSQGEQVRVIFMAEGTSCRYNKDSIQEIEIEMEHRNQCGIKAMDILKVSHYHFYNFPCGRLDKKPIIDIAKLIEKEISNYNPTTVLTHSRNDVHNDHKVVFRAVLQATRPVGNIVKNLLSFEILSSTEWNYTETFKPNVLIDITSTINIKINAMHCYSTEQPQHPHPRSDQVIKSLATMRGSQSGVEYAEGFEVIRLFS